MTSSRVETANPRTDSAASLLEEIELDEWGQVSASVYETARVAALAPDLGGHLARLDFLCREQAPDGSWGEADGYALVPTLSATDALLATVQQLPRPDSRYVSAAHRGLAVLSSWLHAGREIPDTIAVELVVPALITSINARLDRAARDGSASPSNASTPVEGSDGGRLPMPAGMDTALLTVLRDRLARGALPKKLWASLETLGATARNSPHISAGAGAVAGSPAATAAWLGGPDSSAPDAPESLRYLERLQAQGGGALPGVSPITYFEPAWTLNFLAAAGVEYRTPTRLLDRLDAALGPLGAPAGPGLPPDSDDTAGVLSALARHGRLRRPDCLLEYRTDGYFTCFPAERTPSTSTNAHILEALSLYLSRRPAEWTRFGPSAAMAAQWLLSCQRPDGSWQDKWHASPYYATARCALALASFNGEQYRHAARRAASWVLDTQRADGSWGRWRGTIEETAYAVQILARVPLPHRSDAVDRSVAVGRAYLTSRNDPSAYPGLWHAKDLYAPIAVIRAARLAALSGA